VRADVSRVVGHAGLETQVKCPKSHSSLESVEVGGVKIERCPRCEGMWFDRNELRVLKDREDNGDYQWLDVDLWRDMDKFRARKQQRYACPKDGTPMTTVHYADSDIAVDVCSMCKGMWLDKEEYHEIIRYLEEVVDGSSAEDYLKDLRDEFVQAVEGRESPIGVLKDVGKILYLLELRFEVEHPTLIELSQAFPRF
jgi:Zn-finger nucleic acid-binding protein